MPNFPRITQDDIRQFVQRKVAWEQGDSEAWNCDCIIDADLLEKLVKLAARAPYSEKRKVFTYD